jgi:hypothetical protein
MGFIKDTLASTGLGGVLGIESGAEKAAKRAAGVQSEQALASAGDVGLAGQEAIARFDPLAEVGARGLDLSGFLGDPTAQFDFLQNNPLFQSALESANVRTERRAASRGRLSAGDTLEQLTANTFQTARPFLQDQRSDVLNLIGVGERATLPQAQIGRQTAQDVANLQTGGAAASAAGLIGAQNARQQNTGNLIDIAGLIAGGI